MLNPFRFCCSDSTNNTEYRVERLTQEPENPKKIIKKEVHLHQEKEEQKKTSQPGELKGSLGTFDPFR